MSIIHVNQIRNQIVRTFGNLIDLSELTNAPEEMQTAFLLTRGLAAYALQFLAGVDATEAAHAITDGTDDNGIDAVYYDEANKRLYLVQSKWMNDGSGEPSNADVKRFLGGVRNLFNMQFDRFNAKVRARESSILQALTDPKTRYEIVLAYTGSPRLSAPSQRDLDDLAAEMNDTSEVVFITALNQSDLHASLTAGVAGEPINAEIGLKSWGKKDEPHTAFYGQVSARTIAALWNTHRNRLFARNLRSTLGETEVNREMRETVERSARSFWYFNNGITILARRITRSMAGAGGNDFAAFHCEDISIVNGAQTVGAFGKVAQATPEALDLVDVQARLIVRGDDESFAENVTRTNNRQNRVENRDFVALDGEQTRIRTELAIDGIDYQVMRTEDFVRSDRSFDLVESTTALACASGSVRLVVQLKREIGKLWEDIGRAPYRELFNGGVPGLHVWNCVQVQRNIDNALDSFSRRNGRFLSGAIRTHGNRLIAALVFDQLPVSQFRDPVFDLESVASESRIAELTDRAYEELIRQQGRLFANSIVPILFKNLGKCEALFRETRQALRAAQASAAPGG